MMLGRLGQILSRSKTYQHECPDGTSWLVYRNIDDAFPFYIKGWKARLDASVSGLVGSRAGLGGEFEQSFNGVLFAINERNSSVAMDFRLIYGVYQSNPCNRNAFFARQVAILLDEKRKIDSLWLKLQGLIALARLKTTPDSDILKSFADIVAEVGGTDGSVAGREIAEAIENAEDWIDQPWDDG